MHDISGLDSESLLCSFCGKSQKTVGKLISSPSSRTRAFICDECIAVCVSILEDDKQELEPISVDAPTEPHPLLSHPLASELMASVTEWIRHESIGLDASEDLAQVRSIAGRMIADASR